MNIGMTDKSLTPLRPGLAFNMWLKFFAVAIALLVIGPIVWSAATSFKPEAEAVSYPPAFWPKDFTFVNYKDVLFSPTFGSELYYSILYSFGGVILAMIVVFPAAYAASRFQFLGKNTAMLVILMIAMIPATALLAPTFFLLNDLGLVNSPIAIIFISAARIAPQTVWFLQNFIDGVPQELEEAATIDGASRWTSIRSIVLPLMKPGLAATFVLGIIQIWNDYITVATFAPDIAYQTLQVKAVNQAFQAVGMSWSNFMAFVMIASLPVMIIFLLVQRWFIRGLTAGAVKG
jgi:ABC-type glycerol-3-phosphate transport system permease component